jgi:hypothetical protein
MHSVDIAVNCEEDSLFDKIRNGWKIMKFSMLSEMREFSGSFFSMLW